MGYYKKVHFLHPFLYPVVTVNDHLLNYMTMRQCLTFAGQGRNMTEEVGWAVLEQEKFIGYMWVIIRDN